MTVALDRVEAQLADLDGRVFGAGRSLHAANRRADAGNQLPRAEGLGDIVVGAQFQRLHLILFRVAHREHEDGQPGRQGAHAAQRLDAADAGHIHVEQDNVEAAGAQHLQSLFAARGLHHLKAEFDQRRAQRPADGRFIVDKKNANRSLVSSGNPLLRRGGNGRKKCCPLRLIAGDPD